MYKTKASAKAGVFKAQVEIKSVDKYQTGLVVTLCGLSRYPQLQEEAISEAFDSVLSANNENPYKSLWISWLTTDIFSVRLKPAMSISSRDLKELSRAMAVSIRERSNGFETL